MIGPFPRGWYDLSCEEREQYEQELLSLGRAADEMRLARSDRSGPLCDRCRRNAPRVNPEGRCDFCLLTGFLRFASGHEIARFVRRGAVVL